MVLGRKTELRATRDRGPKHVAGGDVGQAESTRDAFGLRALAGAGRAEEHHVELPLRRPSRST